MNNDRAQAILESAMGKLREAAQMRNQTVTARAVAINIQENLIHIIWHRDSNLFEILTKRFHNNIH